MIIGQGMIAAAFARSFADRPDLALFASGVSNSGERSPEPFQREEEHLRALLARKPSCVAYFGTCSVDDPEQRASPYVRHKMRMEDLVRASGPFVVLRLPQVVGRTRNPFTLTNYLYEQIAGRRRFSVWSKARRNIIDVDDVYRIGSYMFDSPAYRDRTVNVASPFSTPVVQLVAAFERALGVSADYELVERGGQYEIDVTHCLEVAAKVGVSFGPDYVDRVVEKYYGTRSGAL
jgi:UDP-2-acetamido-2,6-beta-L-arabino-hexul-4-ose reductase